MASHEDIDDLAELALSDDAASDLEEEPLGDLASASPLVADCHSDSGCESHTDDAGTEESPGFSSSAECTEEENVGTAWSFKKNLPNSTHPPPQPHTPETYRNGYVTYPLGGPLGGLRSA